jgi:hypothetical protein
MTDLQKNPDGTIKLCPLVGYSTFRPFGMMCAIRLEYVQSEGALDAYSKGLSPDAVQVVMHPEQAIDLSEMLQRAAHAVLTPPNNGNPGA